MSNGDGMNFRLRQATSADAAAIAQVFSPSRRLLTFVPELHTVAEDRWFIENIIITECVVTVAETAGRLVSFLALRHDEIRLLHTHPDFLDRGAGTMLLDTAKRAAPGSLQLWCFQANVGARRFYERHGFQAVEFTDGARNEEKTPDVRYRWDPAAGG